MTSLFRAAANLFYGVTILGGLLAGWVVIQSMNGMGAGAGPDFSAVIAVTLAVIPYCIARSFEQIANSPWDDPKPAPYTGEVCRFCAKPVVAGAERCPSCNSKLR